MIDTTNMKFPKDTIKDEQERLQMEENYLALLEERQAVDITEEVAIAYLEKEQEVLNCDHDYEVLSEWGNRESGGVEYQCTKCGAHDTTILY